MLVAVSSRQDSTSGYRLVCLRRMRRSPDRFSRARRNRPWRSMPARHFGARASLRCCSALAAISAGSCGFGAATGEEDSAGTAGGLASVDAEFFCDRFSGFFAGPLASRRRFFRGRLQPNWRFEESAWPSCRRPSMTSWFDRALFSDLQMLAVWPGLFHRPDGNAQTSFLILSELPRIFPAIRGNVGHRRDEHPLRCARLAAKVRVECLRGERSMRKRLRIGAISSPLL